MSHGHYYPNPRRGGRGKRPIPKEFRAEYKKLKAAQRKMYREATPIERGLHKLYKKMDAAREKEARKGEGEVVEIGMPGKKAKKIIIGGIDLLSQVKRIEAVEVYQKKLYKSAQAALDQLDWMYERLEKKLDRAMKKK